LCHRTAGEQRANGCTSDERLKHAQDLFGIVATSRAR
jgi:hypothetical protein